MAILHALSVYPSVNYHPLQTKAYRDATRMYLYNQFIYIYIHIYIYTNTYTYIIFISILSCPLCDMVVSPNLRYRNIDPKYYNPYYGDLQNGTPNFRQPPYILSTLNPKP